MEWQPRHRLKSRSLEIEEVLGEGAFGITYKAHNLVLDVPVVIKTPNSSSQRSSDYPKCRQNFLKEARQLAKLGQNPHPHIVRVSDLFEEDGLPCLVMDFVPGENLYDLVQINGAFSETQALEYIKQIGSALTTCHKKGIIHRDVHPGNILIHAENGKAILIDFGISGTTQSSRNSYSGNRSFAPWEQVVDFEQDKTPQVDIYTLAASLYYLVVGDTPIPSLARKYSNRDLIPPKQLNPNISDRTNRAIIRGMALEIGDRPKSIDAWLKLLDKPKSQDSDLEEIRVAVRNYTKRKKPIPKPSPNPKPPDPLKKPSTTNKTRRNFLALSGFAIASAGGIIWANSRPESELEPKPETPEVDNAVEIEPPVVKTPEPEVTKAQLATDEYSFEVVIVNDRGEEINRESGKASYFKEYLGNGITLDMVYIPGDTFMMGTDDAEIARLNERYDADWVSREGDQHQVKVPEFYMGKFQVTQAQYRAVIGNNPSRFEGENLPVERVSWNDVIDFCQKLSEKTGKEYRLLTEAEWEYACRAGTTTPFHFGETITSELANYRGTSTYANEPQRKFREKTTPVGSFPPNAFGLYDMHGNVWEWCKDDWHDNYKNAPDDGSAWLSKSSNTKVIRGGSYVDSPWVCRSACRIGFNPDVVGYNFGFRLAVSDPRTL